MKKKFSKTSLFSMYKQKKRLCPFIFEANAILIKVGILRIFITILVFLLCNTTLSHQICEFIMIIIINIKYCVAYIIVIIIVYDHYFPSGNLLFVHRQNTNKENVENLPFTSSATDIIYSFILR